MRRLADRIIKNLYDDYVIEALLPHLPGKTSYDLDLILADPKRDAAIMLTKRLDEVEEAARGHVDG
jgi:hypothetical protein